MILFFFHIQGETTSELYHSRYQRTPEDYLSLKNNALSDLKCGYIN